MTILLFIALALLIIGLTARHILRKEPNFKPVVCSQCGRHINDVPMWETLPDRRIFCTPCHFKELERGIQ